MATITKFEDLEIWQLARSLSKKIYVLTNKEPLALDFRLKDQMRGSSGSIMDNIAEGFERGSRFEFLTKKTTNFILYLNTTKYKGQKFKNRDRK
jgi:hypothetical protein